MRRLVGSTDRWHDAALQVILVNPPSVGILRQDNHTVDKVYFILHCTPEVVSMVLAYVCQAVIPMWL